LIGWFEVKICAEDTMNCLLVSKIRPDNVLVQKMRPTTLTSLKFRCEIFELEYLDEDDSLRNIPTPTINARPLINETPNVSFGIFDNEIESQILSEEFFVCTSYTGTSRKFIKMTVHDLGGSYSDVLAIAPSPEGNKFEAAEKWSLTVLRVEWLQKFLENKNRVDETPYLVGRTQPSPNNIKPRESIVPSSQYCGNDSRFDFNSGAVEPQGTQKKRKVYGNYNKRPKRTKIDEKVIVS
jgi:twin BRCT domain